MNDAPILCANCGSSWPSRLSRSLHERKGHPGSAAPRDLLRRRERERWATRDPEQRRATNRAYRQRDPERARAQQRRYRERHPERAADSAAKYRLGHRAEMRERSRAYRHTPEGRRTAWLMRQRQIAEGKHSARMAVTRALQDGTLERLPCRVCSEPRSEAHHHLGYERRFWLVVDWLCDQHHVDAHHPAAARRRERLIQLANGHGSVVELVT